MKKAQILVLFLSCILFVNCSKTSSDELSISVSKERTPSSLKQPQSTSTVVKSLLSINSHSSVDGVLTSLEKSKKTDELLFFQAMILPLKNFKGFIWKVRDVWIEQQVLQIIGYSGLSKIYSTLPIRLDHTKAFTDYFTIPSKDSKKFKNIAEIQDEFYFRKLAPSINSSIDILNQLITKHKDKEANSTIFYYDLALNFGEQKVETLNQKETRYYPITLGDVYIFKSILEQAQGTLTYLASYNFNDINSISKSISQKVKLVGKLISKNVPTLTQKEFHKLLAQKRFNKLYTLRDTENVNNGSLNKSFDLFKRSNQSRIDAYQTFKNYPKQESRHKAYFSNLFQSNGELVKTRIQLVEKLFNSQSPVLVFDPLFSDKEKVNISVLFDETNPSVKDLKKLMANVKAGHFANEKKTSRIAGKAYTNYGYNRKINLPDPSLGGLFPEVNSYERLHQVSFLIQRTEIGLPLTTWMSIFL